MQKTKQIDTLKCSQCDGKKLVNDPNTGEVVCADCGLVLNDPLVSQEPEWRAYTREEEKSRSRVGAPVSYSVFDKGLSTTIGRLDGDASGRNARAP